MSEVVFEPGQHPLAAGSWSVMIDSTISGNADEHLWNNEVADRISAYKPSIVAIDSVEPETPRLHEPLMTKAAIWTALPGTPNKLNGTDEIFVVAGDSVYGQKDPNDRVSLALRTVSTFGLMYLGYKVGIQTYNAFKSDNPEPEIPAIYDHEVREDQEAAITAHAEKESQQLTRRNFLGLACGMAVLGSGFANQAAAISSSQNGKDAAGLIDTEFGNLSLDRALNRDHQYDYLDGRTALLIAKLHDVIGSGAYVDSRSTGSVVMGSGHLAAAAELTTRADLRDQRIRRQAELSLERVASDEPYFGWKSSAEERATYILNHFRAVEVYRVTEPSKKAFERDPKAEIMRTVSRVDRSESPTVVAATNGLIDKYL